jgi:proliferating cell nuclear antigen PCNA
MNITISDKKKKELFISIFNLLKSSSSHINAKFYPDKMHIQGMDKSHICLFDLNLKKDWFSDYTVNEQTDLCFDSSIFYSIISTKGEDQKLVIKKVTEDNLSIELINSEKKSDYSKFFTMPLIDYEYDELNIHENDYDAELSLPSKKVTDMLSQLSNFGDDLNIKCSDDFVEFKTKGTSGEMRVNIPVDDMTSYSVVEGEDIHLNYSLIYISKMCVTNKLSSDIEFNLSSEAPMKIKYDLDEGSSLVFYIATKIADDN